MLLTAVNGAYMEHIIITGTSVDHIDDIMIVENLSFKIPWSREALIEEVTKNKFAVYLSAEASGRIIGYAGMWCVCGEGHITNVAVHPEFRRNSVGTKLMEGLIETARERGLNDMTLEVRKSNLPARKLYEKFGFEEAGFRKSYYADNGEDAVIMWKHGVIS